MWKCDSSEKKCGTWAIEHHADKRLERTVAIVGKEESFLALTPFHQEVPHGKLKVLVPR
jgi:hypothetical protein